MKTILTFALAFFLTTIWGQEKAETEYRIDENEVPADALAFLKALYDGNQKIKWYYEETSGKKSYEAKLKHKNHYHSVEFDTLGRLEDIEIKIEWDEIPDKAKHNIEKHLNGNYQKYGVERIQMQLSGNTDTIQKSIKEDNYFRPGIRYEIEYLGKTQKSHQLWEGLFDDAGVFISKRKIEILPTQNLNF